MMYNEAGNDSLIGYVYKAIFTAKEKEKGAVPSLCKTNVSGKGSALPPIDQFQVQLFAKTIL